MSNTTPTSAVAKPRLHVRDNQIIATSQDVAQAFGKRHDDVLKKIRALEVPEDWHARNFAEMSRQVKIGNGATRADPGYELTRDGFTILSMGFTGKRAMQWKLAYIGEFNRKEAELNKKQLPPPDPKAEFQDFILKEMRTARIVISFDFHGKMQANFLDPDFAMVNPKSPEGLKVLVRECIPDRRPDLLLDLIRLATDRIQEIENNRAEVARLQAVASRMSATV